MRIIRPLSPILDLVLIPFVMVSASLLWMLRSLGLTHFPITKKILLSIGVFPIRDHYYEPLFNAKRLRYSLRAERTLPAIDFNDKGQLDLLNSFHYNEELLQFPLHKRPDTMEFAYNDGPFQSGDAEYLYSVIRHFKPARIIEIGSGSSTLMARNAINRNASDDVNYSCEHICIEPFEAPWLEHAGVRVIRERVELMDLSMFKQLEANDILFIDSSHMIRPQGDVLFEYLEVLPVLRKGVVVHIHDIFTPRDYLDEWLGEYLWNEQYLVEAFLSFNKDFRIVGATNYLSHKYTDQFSSKCPIFKTQSRREPGSLWLVRN